MFEKEFERLIEVVEKGVKEPKFEVIGGDTYMVMPDGTTRNMYHNRVYPKCREVNGLDMFCQLINREWPTRESFNMEEDKADVLYVDVRAHNEVVAYTGSFRNDDSDFMNLTLYRATERLMPGVPTGYMDYDTARIKLNACFDNTPDREYVLGLLSNIVKGDQAEVKDNGITQQVKVQTGIQLAGMETIRPIVQLKPYRTFPEIDQPESDFLLRVNNDQVGIFEADGGMWKLHAKARIRAYLEEELADLIDENKVIVGV